MKHPTFDRAKQKWDAYQAFHIHYNSHGHPNGSGPFVQFDTGEFMALDHSPDPDHRCHQRDWNTQIVSSEDEDCPCFWREPERQNPVPKAWLSDGGQQIFWVDYELGVALALDSGATFYNHKTKRYEPREHVTFLDYVPERLAHYALIYYKGPNSYPLGPPVKLSQPRKLLKEQKDHIQALIDQARAWADMTKENLVYPSRSLTNDLLVSRFEDLDRDRRSWLALRGHEVDREISYTKYLFV
jgi:hypothetical protein